MSEQPPFGETVDHSLTNSGAFPSASVDPPEKPHVHLREPLSEGVAPVNSPGSPEIPDAKSPPDHPPGLQLLGEIARGGMGAILKGRDLDLGRELAVKVLLEAHRGQPEMTRRFLEEAQISGQLQHPGIAPVHELGELPDGRPFFTMKLVKGQTLAALLAARKDVRDDRPRWLGVFAQICQTLAYAHARGVIHRDLKPSNVMVGAFGEVQVMDWGLAKVLQEGGAADERKAQPRPEGSVIRTARSQNAGTPEVGSYTRAGTLLGTPAYLAPEQARGEVELVDERADVFGLGAILCEVLTGQPPFTGKSAEAQHKAQGARLDDAHARLELCGADAELIALAKRCLMAEPWDRPRHASEVAEQVTAYQNAVAERLRQAEVARAAEEARAVEARATAAQERKARRMTLALAASVLLTILLGSGGWLWLHSQRAAKLADNNRAVNEALTKASGLREQARRAKGRLALDLTVRAREQARRAEALVEGGPVEAALAERMRELLAELEAEEVDRQFLAAVDTSRLAQTESNGGRDRFTSGRAVPRFREAFRAYGMPAGQGEAEAAAARLGKRPAAVREAALAAVDEWIDLAENPALKVDEPHVAWLRALLAAAEPEGWEKQVRDVAAKRDAPKRREALRKLAANADVVHLSAHALTRLAQRLQSAGDRPSAVDLLRRAWTHHADNFWINEELGTALQWENRHAEAQLYLSAAVALRPDSMGAHLNLGFAFKNTGKLEEAVAECLKAIELDPNYVVAHVDLALTLNDQGKPAEAIVPCRKAIELDPRNSFAHDFLGRFLRRQGKWDEAIAEHRKAIEIKPKIAWFHLDLGVTLRDARKLNEAVAAYRMAVEIDPKLVSVYDNLGYALGLQGKWDEAIAAYRKWVELEPKNPSAYVHLGNILRGQGQRDEAIAAYRKAIGINPQFAWAYDNLGYARRLQGRWDEAVAAYRKAVELEPKNAWYHLNLGFALRDARKLNEAVAAYRKAVELEPKSVSAYDNLGYALRLQGKWDESVAAYRKAVELEPKNAWFHLNLGFALRNNRKLDEAVAECRKAVELDPKNAVAYFDLGIALSQQKKPEEAIAAYRKSVSIDQGLGEAWRNLASVLTTRGRGEEARIDWQKSIEKDPPKHDAWYGYAELCLYLGQEDTYRRNRRGLLERFGDTTDLVIAERTSRACLLLPLSGEDLSRAATLADRAVQNGEKHNFYPYFLAARGLAEYRRGRFDSAIDCLRKAGARGVWMPVTRPVLAMALHRSGQTRQAKEALAAALRSYDWSQERAFARDNSIAHVLCREAEVLMLPNLPVFLKGEYRPHDNAERLELIPCCLFRGDFRAAATLYADAFAADPELAGARKAPHRYNAGCAAALAAAGRCADAKKSDDSDRSRWRKQALSWLRADLADHDKLLDGGKPVDRAMVKGRLQHWRRDRDLAGIRDKEELTKLPADERQACETLWADVAALLKKASEKK